MRQYVIRAANASGLRRDALKDINSISNQQEHGERIKSHRRVIPACFGKSCVRQSFLSPRSSCVESHHVNNACPTMIRFVYHSPERPHSLKELWLNKNIIIADSCCHCFIMCEKMG